MTHPCPDPLARLLAAVFGPAPRLRPDSRPWPLPITRRHRLLRLSWARPERSRPAGVLRPRTG
ncbi:MAG: hypothetical protein ACKOZT_05310 [Cyanobium sp.]